MGRGVLQSHTDLPNIRPSLKNANWIQHRTRRLWGREWSPKADWIVWSPQCRQEFHGHRLWSHWTILAKQLAEYRRASDAPFLSRDLKSGQRPRWHWSPWRRSAGYSGEEVWHTLSENLRDGWNDRNSESRSWYFVLSMPDACWCLGDSSRNWHLGVVSELC